MKYGIGVFSQGLNGRRFVLQYLWNEAINHMADALKCDIVWTENSDVIDNFISEILKYK